MTVAELKEELAKYPEHWPVAVVTNGHSSEARAVDDVRQDSKRWTGNFVRLIAGREV